MNLALSAALPASPPTPYERRVAQGFAWSIFTALWLKMLVAVMLTQPVIDAEGESNYNRLADALLLTAMFAGIATYADAVLRRAPLILVAVPLGLALGWRLRLYRATQPVIKVLGPLPPVVYVPYAIALLPTFRLAAVWVVFLGAFWPLLARTMQGVRQLPAAHLDVARTLNLGAFTLLRRVIFPGALPAIYGGATVALVFAFVLLTSAELIGASGGIASGLGYYVMYADQIQDHRRVLAGIFVIGLLVIGIVTLFNRIEQRLLRWRD